MTCFLRCSSSCAVVLICVCVASGAAWAQQDPGGCFASDVDFSLLVFRSDGVTPVGNPVVSECETVTYRVTLAKGAGACAFRGGQLSLTTPDGTVHQLTASVPCIGGTGANGSGCSAGVTSFTSALIPYTVRAQDVDGSIVMATARYSGGTLLRHNPPLPNPPLSATTEFAPLQVLFCDDGNGCTIDTCDPTESAFGACQTQFVQCFNDDVCSATFCLPSTGQCVVTPPLDCDDADVCVRTTCDPAVGCVSVPISCEDDDGDACTIQTCDCVVFDRTNCNDHDACTVDSCGSQSGQCSNVAAPYANCDKCGNGIVEPQFGEQCDGATVGDPGSCCDPTCHLRPSSYACRPAAGPCDLAEHCSGSTVTCPADASRPSGFPCPDDGRPCTVDECDGTNLYCAHVPGNAGTVCRMAMGECDVAETCTGQGHGCPPDARKPYPTPCQTDDGNVCTLEVCDGYSLACQHIDAASSTVVCRAAANECDLAELCTKGACPTDAKLPANTSCGADQNACTRDVCNASGTCLHVGEQAGTPCGQNAFCNDSAQCLVVPPSCGNGSPNVGEQCDDGPENGTPGSCCDLVCGFVAGRQECRAKQDVCDVADTCTGLDPVCVDAKMLDGSQCTDDGDPCTADTCAAGACTHQQKPVGAPCGGPGHVCNAGGACVEAGACGNGLSGELSEVNGVFAVEACDLGPANSDQEGTESCCKTTCQLQPTSWICRISSATPCTPDTMCRTGEPICPVAQQNDNTICRREDCVINSACKGGVCVGGVRICDADVQRTKVDKLVPATQARCQVFADAVPSKKRACAVQVTRKLGSRLSEFGRGLIDPAVASVSRAAKGDRRLRKCRAAGLQVAAACGTAIDRDILLCAKTDYFLGVYKTCKPPTDCGRALVRLGRKCPNAVDPDTGTLSDRAVVTISGLQVADKDVGDQSVTRTCVGTETVCD